MLQVQIGLLEKTGLTQVFLGRSVTIRDEYDKRFKNASEIDVLGFGQSSFRQDYLKQFVTWSHKAKIRILLIDPEFPAKKFSIADQRDHEEGNAKGSITRDVEIFIEEVRKLEGLNHDQFRIRLARVLPTTNIFRIDSEIFFGPYFLSQQSRNAPTFLARRGGYLFQVYSDHFEGIWNSDDFSKEIDLSCLNQ